jgi:hypothetical protein
MINTAVGVWWGLAVSTTRRSHLWLASRSDLEVNLTDMAMDCVSAEGFLGCTSLPSTFHFNIAPRPWEMEWCHMDRDLFFVSYSHVAWSLTIIPLAQVARCVRFWLVVMDRVRVTLNDLGVWFGDIARISQIVGRRIVRESRVGMSSIDITLITIGKCKPILEKPQVMYMSRSRHLIVIRWAVTIHKVMLSNYRLEILIQS